MKSGILACAAFLTCCSPALAAHVPSFDYSETCRTAPLDGSPRKVAFDACMRDERAARAQLAGAWDKAAPHARRNCLSLTTMGGLPSYVELLTCLELADELANHPGKYGDGMGDVAKVGLEKP